MRTSFARIWSRLRIKPDDQTRGRGMFDKDLEIVRARNEKTGDRQL